MCACGRPAGRAGGRAGRRAGRRADNGILWFSECRRGTWRLKGGDSPCAQNSSALEELSRDTGERRLDMAHDKAELIAAPRPAIWQPERADPVSERRDSGAVLRGPDPAASCERRLRSPMGHTDGLRWHPRTSHGACNCKSCRGSALRSSALYSCRCRAAWLVS